MANIHVTSANFDIDVSGETLDTILRISSSGSYSNSTAKGLQSSPGSWVKITYSQSGRSYTIDRIADSDLYYLSDYISDYGGSVSDGIIRVDSISFATLHNTYGFDLSQPISVKVQLGYKLSTGEFSSLYDYQCSGGNNGNYVELLYWSDSSGETTDTIINVSGSYNITGFYCYVMTPDCVNELYTNVSNTLACDPNISIEYYYRVTRLFDDVDIASRQVELYDYQSFYDTDIRLDSIDNVTEVQYKFEIAAKPKYCHWITDTAYTSGSVYPVEEKINLSQPTLKCIGNNQVYVDFSTMQLSNNMGYIISNSFGSITIDKLVQETSVDFQLIWDSANSEFRYCSSSDIFGIEQNDVVRITIPSVNSNTIHVQVAEHIQSDTVSDLKGEILYERTFTCLNDNVTVEFVAPQNLYDGLIICLKVNNSENLSFVTSTCERYKVKATEIASVDGDVTTLNGIYSYDAFLPTSAINHICLHGDVGYTDLTGNFIIKSVDSNMSILMTLSPEVANVTLSEINNLDNITDPYTSQKDSIKPNNLLKYQITGFSPRSDFILGDVNSDDYVGSKDSTLLMNYLNGYDNIINVHAADANADGLIDNKDYSVLQQYITDYDVGSRIGTIIPAISAYDIVPHIKLTDGSTKSFKLDKSINTHLDGYYVESGHNGFNEEPFNDNDCGGYIKTQITTANITNNYPSPVALKNKLISEFTILNWDGTIDDSELSLLDPLSSNSETNPYIVETPEQLAYLCMGAGATKYSSTTFGKYYKITDDVDAFNMGAYDEVTLETTASQLKSISSDGSYDINTVKLSKWRDLSIKASITDNGVPFAGTLDGNGCIIYNLYTHGNESALFPWIGVGATIKNLVMKACRSWNWRNIVDGCGSGLLCGAIDNGAAFDNGNNPDYERRITNTTITIENCSVLDCYANTFGDAKFLISGYLRYNHMNISNCLCVNNILEVSPAAYCGPLGISTSKSDLVAFGGLVGGMHPYGSCALKVNNCVVIGDTIMPVLNENPINEQGMILKKGLLFNEVCSSTCYENCYTDTENTTADLAIQKLTNSQMRNTLAKDFMNLDWITPTWHTISPIAVSTLSLDDLYINIDLNNLIEIYNVDGTITKHRVRGRDTIYIEVRPYIYDYGTYYTDKYPNNRYSRDAVISGLYIYAKVPIDGDDGNYEYQYQPVYVKTPTGYREASRMFIKNKNNNYVEV